MKKTQKTLKEKYLDSSTPVRSVPLPLEFPGIHYMNDEELEAATGVLKKRSPFRFYGINTTEEVQAFESEFASFVGVKRCLAVHSGTAALHTALSALGVGPGQEVIIPAYMWVSVVAAVVNLGAIPVLADIDGTFGLNAESLEEHITSRTSGVIAVHMSGAQADLPKILEVCRRRNIFVLEDCAQCAGGSIGAKKVGSFGDMAVFSFQMNKNMTSGEGGCVVTNDERLYQRAFACHDNGYARDASGRARFDDLDLCLWGRGYRLDEIRGSILRVQLRKLPTVVSGMHKSKYRIRKAIANYSQISLRTVVDPAGDTGSFLISTYESSELAKEVNLGLRAQGIATYSQGVTNVIMSEWGLHIYSNIKSLVHKTSVDKSGSPWRLAENRSLNHEYGKGTCPVADSLFERSILIAIPSCLTEQDEDDIIEAFRRVLNSA